MVHARLIVIVVAALGLSACAISDQPTIYVAGAKEVGPYAATIHCNEQCRLIRDEAGAVIAARTNRQGCFMGCLTDIIVPPGVYELEVTECFRSGFGRPRIDVVFDLHAAPGHEYWVEYREVEEGNGYTCYNAPFIRDARGRPLNVEWGRRL